MNRPLLLVFGLFFAHCNSSSSPAPPTVAEDGGADAASSEAVFGGSRPVTLHIPASYSEGTAMPLVILLHGYTSSGEQQEAYLGITALADARGFLYAHPDGLKDGLGNQFWNATDACCNFVNNPVDDSAYLSAFIKDVQARYTVDPKRVFLVGHSNGAFMAYRMACDHADQVAGIVSLAGAMYLDAAKCKPSAAVNVLQIHGTSDEVISYTGGDLQGHPFPSAETTVGDWVAKNGCGTTADTSPPALDLEGTLAGAETTVKRFATGCRPGGQVELWTIQKGTHIPNLSKTFTSTVIDYALAHPRP